jgi:hypothetical protein
VLHPVADFDISGFEAFSTITRELISPFLFLRMTLKFLNSAAVVFLHSCSAVHNYVWLIGKLVQIFVMVPIFHCVVVITESAFAKKGMKVKYQN